MGIPSEVTTEVNENQEPIHSLIFRNPSLLLKRFDLQIPTYDLNNTI